jgi:hypothetical protein
MGSDKDLNIKASATDLELSTEIDIYKLRTVDQSSLYYPTHKQAYQPASISPMATKYFVR